jgi:hypothetical protein
MQPWFRQIKYGILFVILLMAAFGSLAFMFFDPITVLVRGVADPFRVGMSIYSSPGVRLLTLVSMVPLLAVLWLNRIEKRFWCRYLCPLGAIVGLGSKFAWVRRNVAAKCVTCGECARPARWGRQPETIKNDPAECVMCPIARRRAMTAIRSSGSCHGAEDARPQPRAAWVGSAGTAARPCSSTRGGARQAADLLRPQVSRRRCVSGGASGRGACRRVPATRCIRPPG